MKKNKEIGPAFMYKDQIWKVFDDGKEEMIWENSLHANMFGNDDAPDSEYNKMMDLERETNFFHLWEELDYWFEHRYVRVCVKNNEEQVVRYESLLEEFINT